MNQEYPLVVSFFEIDNHTELPIQSFPFKHQIDKNFFRFFFPIAPSYLHSSFLCIDSQQQMFCYVKQTDECTFVLTSQYLHWSLFINILLHLIQLPSPQRVLFLSSLHHLIPLPTLNQLNYPLFSFHSQLPQPINQPSSGCLSSLLCLPITQLMMLFSSILNERRIIIQSNSAQKISEFIVSLLEIFSPLKWQHLLVPFLPIKYTELTETPTPFIIGVDPSIMEIIDLFDIIVFVDIDKGIIKSTDSTIIKSDYELIPSKWINSITNSLKPIYSHSETIDDKNPIIKKAFNELMNCFIKDIEMRIRSMIETNTEYNVKEFYKDYFFLGEERKFIEMFSKTAAFDQFVLETEQKYKSEGIKLKRKPSLLSWFNKEELIDVDNATLITPTKENQQLFNLL
ncbi:hypothetical protein ENUP19_0050G0088 [Entamoeba nuttalli]|uniref:UDENN domain-containing protein n=1 Tax=Entamoeba nuttalli TaxID=412467 RepID=A0ABQ0DBT5_9EUKA